MTRALDRFRFALRAAGCRGRGTAWTCPAHHDRRASLSVREGRDGRVLVHCHAGCSVEAILEALGLEARDLFAEDDQRTSRDERRIVAAYTYTDEKGDLLFEVVRYHPKAFRQRRPNGRGGWTWNLDHTRRVLYRLPPVLSAVQMGKPIYVVEGEKDVHTLESLGLCATTNPGGAGKWRDEYSEYLRGAQVFVIADRDEPGRRHARDVARSLDGVAASVKILEPPSPWKDVSELVSAGGSLEDLLPLGDGAAEPNAEPVALDGILDELEAFIRRFIVFRDDHQAAAVTLWVPHVYAIDAAPAAAYLRIMSATEEAGKTTLLEVLEVLLGDRALNAVSASPAWVFRTREKRGPVALLLDEIDQTLRDRKDDGARDLLAIVNAGYRRSAKVGRTVGRDHEPRDFKAFGPCAIAGLGRLHPTTESRCIPIVLERKPRRAGERWMPHLVEDEACVLRERLARWATVAVGELAEARPDIPEGLRDRHAEVWWTLFAIADMAGGEWPSRARSAALALHNGQDFTETASLGVLLLAHVREAFEEAGADRLPTAELLRHLVANEEGPWGRFWGAELNREGPPRAAATDLARHLRPFGVRPRVIRMPDGSSPRGYARSDFERAWDLYLPREGDATDATDATPLPGMLHLLRLLHQETWEKSGSPSAGATSPREGDVTPVTDVTPLARDVTSVTSVTSVAPGALGEVGLAPPREGGATPATDATPLARDVASVASVAGVAPGALGEVGLDLPREGGRNTRNRRNIPGQGVASVASVAGVAPGALGEVGLAVGGRDFSPAAEEVPAEEASADPEPPRPVGDEGAAPQAASPVFAPGKPRTVHCPLCGLEQEWGYAKPHPHATVGEVCSDGPTIARDCVRCERYGDDHEGPCIARWEDCWRRERWLREVSPGRAREDER